MLTPRQWCFVCSETSAAPLRTSRRTTFAPLSARTHAAFLGHHSATKGEGIDIDLGQLPSNEGTHAYWDEAQRQIERVVGGKLRDGIERGDVRHLSVFALARIPILVVLGYELDDKLATDVYQRHRTGAWTWHAEAEPVEFEARAIRAGTDPTRVVLLISLSGSVALADLPGDVSTGASVFEIRPLGTTPDRDILRSPASLQAFEHCYHGFLSRLEQDHPAARAIDVFPAIPVSAAVALGRGLMRDAHPALRVYDRDDDTYTLAVEINQ